MVAGVTAKLEVSVSGRQTGPTELSTPLFPFDLSAALNLLPGTDATSKANTLFLDQRTLTTGATENLDMAGVLVDAFGATVANAEVVAIYLKAADANTTDLTFFGAASNAFNGPLTGTTPKLTLGPGEFVLLTSKRGWAVTAGTGDIILCANGSGASAIYDVAIIGRTVAA